MLQLFPHIAILDVVMRNNKGVNLLDSQKDRVEIRSIGDSSIFTEISINGHKLNGVRSYKLEQIAGQIARLTLDFSYMNVAVDQTVVLWDKHHDCEMEISFKIPEMTEEYLEEMRKHNEAYQKACEQDNA